MIFPKIRTAVLALAIIALASPALPAADHYEFQAGSGELKAGKGRVISIKLIDKRTKKPVSGATFVHTALDMSPENMADTKGKIAADTSTDPNVYRFKADFSLSGVWALKLKAKVPGEGQTVEGVLILRAND
jgi:hypothetical protein